MLSQEQLVARLKAQIKETAKVRGFIATAAWQKPSEEAEQRAEAAEKIKRQAMREAVRNKVPEDSAHQVMREGLREGAETYLGASGRV